MGRNEKIDVNRPDVRGLTPLHAAGIRSSAEIVELLCSVKGIELNIKDKMGRTPLMIAVMTNNTEAVRVLVQQSTIDLNTSDNNGNTLDDFAKERREILNMLINARKHAQEITKLCKIKELLLSHISGKQETELKVLKIRCLMEKKLLEKKVRGGRKKKEKNVGEVYSSENVENYQGNLDIETILHSIENLPKKPLVCSEKSEEVIKAQPLCNKFGCFKVSVHRCSRCRLASFCSRQCSIDYWPDHQRDCDQSIIRRKQRMKNVRRNSLSEVD
eukprot:GFUD01012319.1.p1 GENE.GFUD01012319.1~~GFUD01012319.1.p1  ORF type:complete len:273 (-),score=46.25 GFUD01012319.1:40-858(-)